MKFTRPHTVTRDLYDLLRGEIAIARCAVCKKEMRVDLGEGRYGKPECCGVKMKLGFEEQDWR